MILGSVASCLQPGGQKWRKTFARIFSLFVVYNFCISEFDAHDM